MSNGCGTRRTRLERYDHDSFELRGLQQKNGYIIIKISMCSLYLLLKQNKFSSALMFSKISFRELVDAGVLGLEDYLLPAESDSVWETKSAASENEMKASDGCYNQTIPETELQVFHSGSDLLSDLRQVHMLDEMIVEEKLKICSFRHTEKADEELPRSNIKDSSSLSVRNEREAFRLQLEKEKREVDNLEKSLENEFKLESREDGSKKVIRCSVMERSKTEEKGDEAHSYKDLSGTSNGSCITDATLLVCSDSEPECKTENHEEVLDPQIATEKALIHLIHRPASKADHFECQTSLLSWSDLKPVQLPECMFSENPPKPEASLTPEQRPDDGAFDPGGQRSVPPVPKPRTVLLVDDKPSEDETLHSRQMPIPSLSSVTDNLVSETAALELPESPDTGHNMVPTTNVTEHQNNNNNNHTPAEKHEIPSDCVSETDVRDNTSVAFTGLEEGDLQSVEEMRTLSPVSWRLLPEPPLELEPCRRDHHDVPLADGVLQSEWMKVSADGEAQVDVSIRQVKYICL